MLITVDTSNPISAADRRVLRALLDASEPTSLVRGPDYNTEVYTSDESETQSDEAPGEPETEDVLDQEFLTKAAEKALAIIQAQGEDGEKRVANALAETGFERVTFIDSNEAVRVFLKALGE